MWVQKTVSLGPFPRGCHLVAREILATIPEIEGVQNGLLNLFLQHTSAGLGLTENADPDVLKDMSMALDGIVPESGRFRHSSEGADDMPAHVKTVLVGNSLTLPVANGKVLLGKWQGIHLFEFRNRALKRNLILTLQGQPQPEGTPP